MIVYEYRCRGCDEPLTYPGVGRPRVYCDSCRPDWFPAVKEVPSAVSMAFPGFPEAPTTRTVPVKAHERRVSGPPSVPLARTTDPDTSRAAAVRIRPGEHARRRAVLHAFVEHGPMIVAEVHQRVGGRSNTIAGAVSRYALDGWLEATGERRQSPWGSWMREYQITDAGRWLLAQAVQEAS